jgi:predicted TIM-barrel fold metal-dependent hydrolase
MQIIDGQVHELGLPRFWEDAETSARRAAYTTALTSTLAAVGVEGALIHAVEDLEWAFELAAEEPDRFAVLPMVMRSLAVQPSGAIDPDADDAQEQMAAARARPGCVGFRFIVGADDVTRGGEIRDEGLFRFCSEHQMVVCSPFAERPEHAAAIAAAFPDLTVVVDHLTLGGAARFDPESWDRLPQVLHLARHSNVHLKLTGLAALSREPSPHRDLEAPLGRLLDGFGVERCFWGSDIGWFRGEIGVAGRFPERGGDYRGKQTYAEAVDVLRDADWLDASTRAALLGENARRIFGWATSPGNAGDRRRTVSCVLDDAWTRQGRNHSLPSTS